VQDPVQKAYVENALASLGDPAGLAALRRNLYDKNPEIRAYSAETVGHIHGEQFASRLEQLLADSALDVRIRAAQSLLMLSSYR
jgi:HEAT repeat protein